MKFKIKLKTLKDTLLCVCVYVQLTLEQHRFELCGSTYMQIFSKVNNIVLEYIIHSWMNLLT